MDIDSDYILVKNREGGDLTEIDLDDDGNLAVESLQSQFGGSAIGLRFQNPATGNFRAVKVQCGVLFPPRGGWGSKTYFVATASDADKQPTTPTRQPEGCNSTCGEADERKVCQANVLFMIQIQAGCR